LYRRYSDRLLRFVLRFATSGPEADEICQEVWTAIIRGSERFRGDARFVTYLFSIARRRTVERYRRAHEEDDTALDDLQASEAPEEMLFSSQANSALAQAICDLPVLQREALLLRLEGAMDIAQIARVTGTNHETAKSRLRYAYRKLRIALEDWR
jgi:RNA polymerase sigma-70 factor (ECF subfamily)